MKRYLKLILILSFLLFVFINSGLTAFAVNEEKLFDYIGTEKLLESIPDEVSTLLSELGVNDIDFTSILNVKAKDLWRLAKTMITGAIESPIKSMLRIFYVIILLAVCESFIKDDVKLKYVVEMFGTLFCVITVIKPISDTISSAVASVKLTESFMLVLIVVLTSVVSAAGNPGLAVSFQSIAFIGAQIIAGIASGVLVPLTGVVLSLDISGTMIPTYKLNSITDFIKKTITTSLSVCATVYVSFLGLKSALANAADTFASKGIKLIISTTVPVVGAALSETYSGIVGSMILARSTIAVLGIGVIALINFPSCLQLVFWIFAFKAGNAVASLFEQDSLAVMFKAFASTLVLLNAVLLFVAVLFIISTALILVIKAG